MDFSPNALLAAKGIEAPNVAQIAGQGISLGDLMAGLQGKQYQLQGLQQSVNLMQDPAMAQAYAQMLGGGGQGDTSGLAAMIQANPMGALQTFPGMIGAAQKAAEARSFNAGATEKESQTLDQARARAAAAVANAGLYPSNESVAGAVTALRQAGLSSDFAGPIPSDMTQIPQWSKQAQAALIQPKTLAETGEIQARIPGILAANVLGQEKAANFYSEFALEAKKYNLDASKFYSGELQQTNAGVFWVGPGPQGNKISIKLGDAGGFSQTPPNAPPVGAPPPGVTMPVPGSTATPAAMNAQTAPLTPQQQAMQNADNAALPPKAPTAPFTMQSPNADLQKQLTDYSSKAQSAGEMQQLITQMRSQDAQGILSGGVMGNDEIKKLVNVLGGMGALSPEMYQKLSSTQTFDATSRQVIAQAVSQFAGARIAARELQFFTGAKPTTDMTPQAREGIYDELFNSAQRMRDTAQQAGAYIKNGGATDLTQFQPQYQHVNLPPITLPHPPPAGTVPLNKIWKDSNGLTYKQGLDPQTGQMAWIKQ